MSGRGVTVLGSGHVFRVGGCWGGHVLGHARRLQKRQTKTRDIESYGRLSASHTQQSNRISRGRDVVAVVTLEKKVDVFSIALAPLLSTLESEVDGW